MPGTTESICRTTELPSPKFEPSVMLKAVVGTENPANEYQTKNVGR